MAISEIQSLVVSSCWTENAFRRCVIFHTRNDVPCVNLTAGFDSGSIADVSLG
jgi:hypothetical protein